MASEVVEVVKSAWRWMVTDVRHLGLIDFKWIVLLFLLSAAISGIVREVKTRRLERRNALLRLILSVQSANEELRRRGSTMVIDTDEVEAL